MGLALVTSVFNLHIGEFEHLTFFQDESVGSGSGMYEGQKLFQARIGHASLIPIMGLIKAEEYKKGRSQTFTGMTFRLPINRC